MNRTNKEFTILLQYNHFDSFEHICTQFVYDETNFFNLPFMVVNPNF
jgi:hypothetical protein